MCACSVALIVFDSLQPQGLYPLGFSRQEYWSGLLWPRPGDLPSPGSNLRLPHCRRILYHWATWEAQCLTKSLASATDSTSSSSPLPRNQGGQEWKFQLSNHVVGSIDNWPPTLGAFQKSPHSQNKKIFYYSMLRRFQEFEEIEARNCRQRPNVVVQLLSHVRLFVTLWTAAHQASLSFTISQSLLKLVSIESVMPSNHLILCCPFLLLPSIFPSIRVFSNEWALPSWLRQ